MGERWEYLCFKTETGHICEVDVEDSETRDILVGLFDFQILKKLGKLGWKMAGMTTSNYDPFRSGFLLNVFVREIR